MALASAAVPIATVDEWQSFSINRRQIVSVQIRFYSDALGTTLNLRTVEPVYVSPNTATSYRDTLTSSPQRDHVRGVGRRRAAGGDGKARDGAA
jgi:hypothetical protein